MHAGKAEALKLAPGVVHPVGQRRGALTGAALAAVHVVQQPFADPLSPGVLHAGAGVERGQGEVVQQVVGDQLVQRGLLVFIARPIGHLAGDDAGLQVAQRDRHRRLLHDGRIADHAAGAAVGHQGQPPFGAAFHLFLEVERGAAEVRVVVVVAVQRHRVQELEAGAVLPLVGQVHRVGKAADPEILEPLRFEGVFQRLGLDGDAVEVLHLLRCHAPLRGCAVGRLGGRHVFEPGLQLVHPLAQRAQLLDQLVIALGLRRRGQRQRQQGRSQRDGSEWVGVHHRLLVLSV